MQISYRFTNFELAIVENIIHPLTLVCVHKFGISVKVPLETDAEGSWKCVQVNTGIVFVVY